MTARPQPTSARPLLTLLVALLMTLGNAFEPFAIDDACHHYYASQAAREPLRPYEFEVVWHQQPSPAWEVMVPPVYPYLWAPAIALFGDAPVAWRLWFLPLHWLFCWGLLALLQRYARAHEVPLLWFLALGPTVLPGINHMLEMPLLAFGIAGLAVLHQSFDRRSNLLACASGGLLGLALQTKFSALAFVGPWCMFAVLHGRWRELLYSLAGCAAVAGGIEALVALSHGGQSYFLHHLTKPRPRSFANLLTGMFVQFGVLGALPTLLALVALPAPRWILHKAIVVYALGHALVLLVPGEPGAARSLLAPGTAACLVMALYTWGTAAWLLWRLTAPALGELRRHGLRGDPDGAAVPLALVGWVVAEVALSLLMSPFAAARRALTALLALTVAAGWLAARRPDTGPAVRRLALCSALLGIGYQVVDGLDGQAAELAATRATAAVRAIDANAPIYFGGGWSFEFYAPRAGMQPLRRAETDLQPGDFVVVGSIDGQELPWFGIDDRLQRVETVAITDAVPLSVQICYYSGLRPFEAQVGPRYVATVYRATVAIPNGTLRANAPPR